MIPGYPVEQVRAAERSAMAVRPGDALMQQAAAALAARCVQVLRDRAAQRGPRAGAAVVGARVVLLVGPGSNGGDALWAGARLARRGARVVALAMAAQVHREGRDGLLAAGGAVRPLAGSDELPPDVPGLLADADILLDGVLGIGARPGLHGVAGRLADLLAVVPSGPRRPAGRRPYVVAVDLPSGVDPDTGRTPARHLRADRTLTFGLAKPGVLLPPGAHAAGALEVVDIGLAAHLPGRDGSRPAVELVEASDVAACWPRPHASSDKYSRGVLGVVAGSSRYTGAAVLCVGAACRSGAGMVRYVGPERAADHVRIRWPEAVVDRGRVQAWVLGPGLDPDADDGQAEAAREALASSEPCVVDAGALGLLAPGRRAAPTVLTPHAGELARLLVDRGLAGRLTREQVDADPATHARRAAQDTGGVVLLKGAICVIAHPDGRTRVAHDGPAWLATAGSGDVLAGILGTLLAAGLDPLDAAGAAVLVHGRAGGLAAAGGPLVALDVADAVRAALTSLPGWDDAVP